MINKERKTTAKTAIGREVTQRVGYSFIQTHILARSHTHTHSFISHLIYGIIIDALFTFNTKSIKHKAHNEGIISGTLLKFSIKCLDLMQERKYSTFRSWIFFSIKNALEVDHYIN